MGDGFGFLGDFDVAADAGDFGEGMLGADGDVGVEAGEEAEKLFGILGEPGLEGVGLEVLEGALEEGGQEGGREVGKVGAGFGLEAGETGEDSVALGDSVFEAVFFAEPVLVAGFVPAGEVGLVDAVILTGENADAGDDFLVDHAFAQGLVDHFADAAGKEGDVGAGAVAGSAWRRQGGTAAEGEEGKRDEGPRAEEGAGGGKEVRGMAAGAVSFACWVAFSLLFKAKLVFMGPS